MLPTAASASSTAHGSRALVRLASELASCRPMLLAAGAPRAQCLPQQPPPPPPQPRRGGRLSLPGCAASHAQQQQQQPAAGAGPHLAELRSVQQPLRLLARSQSLQAPPCGAWQPAANPYLPPAGLGRITRTSSVRTHCSAASAAAAATPGAGAAAAAPAGRRAAEEPIIVTISWLGAKRGPFSKYKQLWQTLGYSRVLSARPPMSAIMFPLQGQLLAERFAARLLAAAAAAPRAPVLVHLFSGGGFIFWGWLLDALARMATPEADALRGRIAGVVLDSSPASVTADVSSRALVAAALGKPADGIEQAYPWLVKPAAAIVDGYLRLPFVRGALTNTEAAWARHGPPCPKLFLYSEADALISPEVVEAFKAQQEAAGCATYAHRWSDSAHVDHYRAHPEEYRQQLAAFVEAALHHHAASAAAQQA